MLLTAASVAMLMLVLVLVFVFVAVDVDFEADTSPAGKLWRALALREGCDESCESCDCEENCAASDWRGLGLFDGVTVTIRGLAKLLDEAEPVLSGSMCLM